jgi:hypothetical protein
MPSTAKQAETTAYENVRSNPLTRVHGRPTRSDYEILKSEASALASEVEDITYSWSTNATDNYGLLGDILGADEYYELTNIDSYVIPNEPASYDPAITNATLTHERKRREEEWDLIRTAWYIRKGFLRGIVDNLRDALDEQYYAQLKNRLTAYRNVTPFQILDHLNDRWCPLDVKAKKALKDAYYTKWDGDEHLTAFGKRLDDDQRALVRSDVTIADEDKLQFYLEQMYDSNHFEKSEMLDWEKKPSITKADYVAAKDYFEELVKATDTYTQNAGRGTAGRNKYESANHMADIGDEIREYIANLANASAVAAQEQAANTMDKTSQFDAMAAQIKALTDAVAKLAAASENKVPNAVGTEGKKGHHDNRRPQQTPLRNMGAYCSSHGFHPVGVNHNSATCKRKRPEHKSEATWGNRLGGSTSWPTATRVAVVQHNHPTWKGKAAPTT